MARFGVFQAELDDGPSCPTLSCRRANKHHNRTNLWSGGGNCEDHRGGSLIMNHPDQPGPMDAYQVAHEILTSSPIPGEERRGAPRHPFANRQWIAPYDGSHFPDQSEFSQVRCRDLSRTGFSFVVSEKPDFSSLVVYLGDPPNHIPMAAEVVRSCRVRLLGGGHIEMIDDEAGDGNSDEVTGQTILVGCQFKGRVN